MRRFNFFDEDGQILKSANKIRLELEVAHDGKMWLEYQISGSITHFPDQDDDEEAAVVESQPEASELAGDLLAKFLSAKGGR